MMATARWNMLISPQGVAFRTSLAELEGGEEAAQKVLDE
jgi:hypothetical protein